MTDTPGTLEERLRDPRYCGQEGMRAEAADEIESLRARVEAMRDALEKLIVVVEFEVPPIRDGVDVDHRLDVLAMSAREARQALKDTRDAE